MAFRNHSIYLGRSLITLNVLRPRRKVQKGEHFRLCVLREARRSKLYLAENLPLNIATLYTPGSGFTRTVRCGPVTRDPMCEPLSGAASASAAAERHRCPTAPSAASGAASASTAAKRPLPSAASDAASASAAAEPPPLPSARRGGGVVGGRRLGGGCDGGRLRDGRRFGRR